MVGVPGKSKGCATCRRRKIGCDLQQPACRKCLQSGRECEGYARFPVFLNRTIQGPQKRHGLEEAKKPLAAPTDPSMISSVSFLRAASERRNANNVDHRILLQPDTAAVVDQQLISSFWEKYVPLTSRAQDGSACIWLDQIIQMPNPGETLQLSLKAFAMARLGWITRDESLALQGNRWYIHALQSIQKALWSENAATDDEIFAAGYILAVYELFETTTTSIAGWHSHITGLSQLIMARGPHRHRSPIPRATLEEFRTSAMIQSLLYCKSSFLASDEWQRIPWEETPKDVYQKLYDKGFVLAGILEELEKAKLSNLSSRPSDVFRFLQMLSNLDTEMDLWHQELVEVSPSPIYWPIRSEVNSTYSTRQPTESTSLASTLPPFAFQTLRLANITTTYWGLRIILANVAAIICGSIISALEKIPVGSPGAGNLKGAAQRLLQKTSGTTRVEYSILIMRSMAYSMNESMGLIGAQKCLFGFRTAMSCLQRNPGEELRWCNAVYQELEKNKGLRYATEIAKINGRPGSSDRGTPPIKIEETFAAGESMVKQRKKEINKERCS